jgi:hypothetical protein
MYGACLDGMRIALFKILLVKKNMKHYRFYILLIFIILAGCTHSLLKAPKGWRLPTIKEMSGSWADFLGTKEKPYYASADLNGDTIADEAYIALSTTGSQWALFVNLNQTNGPPTVILLEELEADIIPQTMGVQIVVPGKYRTACGKGYWDCDQNEPEELNLLLPAINFYAFESANSFFWWDKNSGSFRCTWMSD